MSDVHILVHEENNVENNNTLALKSTSKDSEMSAAIKRKEKST